jgi:hypothetical protein
MFVVRPGAFPRVEYRKSVNKVPVLDISNYFCTLDLFISQAKIFFSLLKWSSLQEVRVN